MGNSPSQEQTVELKNGAVEFAPLVAATMMNLRDLFTKDIPSMCAAYDLAERCKNPEHQISDTQAQILEDRNLITRNGSNIEIHSSIRNIVLSAVQGEELNMSLGNPLK